MGKLESGKRIKFRLVRNEGSGDVGSAWMELAEAAKRMEEAGWAPAMPDGGVAGNLAVRYRDGLLVSRSGKRPGRSTAEDFVHVVRFDPDAWEAHYISARPDISPSSDTPLYWTALIEVPAALGWEGPCAAVHGHALETDEAARRLNIPIARQETEFSTPEDRAALRELLSRYPYPKHTIWIRKGHGFFAVGRTIREALETATGASARYQGPTPGGAS